MVSFDKDFFALELRHKSDQRIVLATHCHITEDVDCVAVGHFFVPPAQDIFMHLIQALERTAIVIDTTVIHLAPAEEVQVADIVVHGLPLLVIARISTSLPLEGARCILKQSRHDSRRGGFCSQ